MSKLFTIMTGAIMMQNPVEFPNLIGTLNKQLESVGAPGRVHELYGSMRHTKSGLPTGRPDFRLEDISFEYLEKYVKACHANGLIFNYTMNANYIGNLAQINAKYSVIVDALKKLEDIGIDRITVSHPILLDIVCNHTNIPIEVSTILNINSLQAPRELKQRYPNINKICMSIDKIRNIDFVSKMQQECEDNGILLETMVSEFCAIGFMSCSQLHRNFCYNMHSMNMPQDIAQKSKYIDENGNEVKMEKEVSGYPWTSGKKGCIFNRAIDSKIWLSSRTIWPNEIAEYIEMTGVKQIKITTRTAPADFALKLTRWYAEGHYDGPLAGLWLALQGSTLNVREQFDEIQSKAQSSIPYLCKDLSKKHKITMKLCYKGTWESYEGEFKFMDLFFLYSEIDWTDIVWVDKPDDELKEYECNWIAKWHKLLTK